MKDKKHSGDCARLMLDSFTYVGGIYYFLFVKKTGSEQLFSISISIFYFYFYFYNQKCQNSIMGCLPPKPMLFRWHKTSVECRGKCIACTGHWYMATWYVAFFVKCNLNKFLGTFNQHRRSYMGFSSSNYNFEQICIRIIFKRAK